MDQYYIDIDDDDYYYFISLFKVVIHHRDLAIGNSQPQGTIGKMLVQWCSTGIWWPAVEGSGARLLSARLFQAQNVCLQFAHLLILETIYTEYRILLNSPLPKKKRQNMGKHWKTKAILRFVFVSLGFLTEGPRRCCRWESDLAWPSGELKCCSGYIKIETDF